MRFSTSLLEIEVSSRKETTIIKLNGALNTATREELIRHLEPIRREPTVREVILNMDGLTHIDSRGLATLLTFYRQFTEREVGFRLVNVHDYVLKLLQVSNLVNLFEIGPPPENEAVRVQSRREALWQSHAFTTQLIAALGEAVLGLDRDEKILFANPAAERLLAWDEAELLGRTLKETIWPGETAWPPSQGEFEEGPGAPGGETPVIRCETTVVTRDGESLEVELVATTIFQSGERIGKVLGIRDLSQRRQAREELRRLATAVDQSAEMILITDPEGIIQYVNPSFERITGFTREEAVGYPVSILKSGVHDDEFFGELWNTVLSGRVWKGRFTNKRKDGRFYEEEATISPVHDAMGNIINLVAVKRDITEQVMLEQQLRESQKVEAIAQLAGGIAHDFNNLLTTVIGNIQLARTRQGMDIQGYLQRAEQACLRGASLVQQLLLYSRKSASEKERVDLNLIIREVLALARETIDRRIEIVTDLREELPPVKADPGQLHQVLLNLVVNARDAIVAASGDAHSREGAAPAPGGVLRITIRTDLFQLTEDVLSPDVEASPGEYVVLSVTDTGVGMDAKTQAHLFEPFFTTKEVGKGTGLGLATAYGIIKNHRGWITVDSELGVGSTFSVYLLAAQSQERTEDSLEPPAALTGGEETILVVDDEPSICDLARDTLTSYGYSVFTAKDGEEAVELYAREWERIDLVVLDLSMPRMSGREALRNIREINPQARVIVSSGYLRHATQLEFADCTFVQKPYRLDQLIRGVREALDREIHLRTGLG